jgi:hypothetical protein
VLHLPVDRSEPEFKLLQIPRKWHARAIRVNGCSSDCKCSHTTYAKYFTFPLNHTLTCRYIYIGAPEQRVDSRKRDLEGLEVNQCIKSLTGDTSWKGPVFAYGIDVLERPKNMETRIFGQILSSFRSVLGVRINRDGLVQAHDTPRFEVITIESSGFRGRTSFRCGTQDSVTNHTGIVLQLRRDFQQGTRNHADLDKRNSISRLLSIPCDTESHDFGHYDPSLKVGNVIVIRADRKPLDVEYLEVLCEWIQNELRPRFEKARAECTRVDQLVSKEINRKIKQRTIRKKGTETHH